MLLSAHPIVLILTLLALLAGPGGKSPANAGIAIEQGVQQAEIVKTDDPAAGSPAATPDAPAPRPHG